MANIEKVTQKRVEVREVEVEVEEVKEVVLRLKVHEAEALARLVADLDLLTAESLNLWSLKNQMKSEFGLMRDKYTREENTLGFIRMKKTT